MSYRGVLIIFLGICSGLCFAQQKFEIILERAEISDVNSEFVQVEAAVRKYNRTSKAFYSNCTLFKDLDTHVKLELQGYALFSNQYRLAPFLLIRSICDIFSNEFLWFKDELGKYGNLPTKCPVRPGFYYMKDYVPTDLNMPAAANIPWKSVMIRFRFFYDDTIIFTFKLYGTLDHDAELKRMG